MGTENNLSTGNSK